MTALATSTKRGGLLAPLVPSEGIGPDASVVAERIKRICDHLKEALSLRRVAESASVELEEVASEAASPNWDGYGAQAVDPRTVQEAKRLLDALPTTTPVPEVSADPDGEVAISWNLDSSWVFSVSVGPSGRLSYAGLFGTSKAYGTEWFLDEIPEAILDNISRLFKARGTHAA